MKRQILLSGLLLAHVAGLSADETWKEKAKNLVPAALTFTASSTILCAIYYKFSCEFSGPSTHETVAAANRIIHFGIATVALMTLYSYLQTADSKRQSEIR